MKRKNFFMHKKFFLYKKKYGKIDIKQTSGSYSHSWTSFNYFITLYKLCAAKLLSLLSSYTAHVVVYEWHVKIFVFPLLSRISHSSNSIPTNSCLCLLSDQRSMYYNDLLFFVILWSMAYIAQNNDVKKNLLHFRLFVGLF